VKPAPLPRQARCVDRAAPLPFGLGGGECLYPTHTATTVWLQSGPFPDTMELLG
jgi:hypothetical protein